MKETKCSLIRYWMDNWVSAIITVQMV